MRIHFLGRTNDTGDDSFMRKVEIWRKHRIVVLFVFRGNRRDTPHTFFVFMVLIYLCLKVFVF